MLVIWLTGHAIHFKGEKLTGALLEIKSALRRSSLCEAAAEKMKRN